MVIFASDPITNHYSGISISFSGTDEVDYAFERYYHEPTVDDHGVCYIIAETQIMLAHSALNSRTSNSGSYSSGATIIGTNGGGIIRYKVDRDLQLKFRWAVGSGSGYSCTESGAVPKYTGPLSFNTMTYLPDDGSVKVLGATGLKPGTNITDRANGYYRGQIGPFGDEWHWLGYGDDDAAFAGNYTEWWASDGKSMLFVVNPKTPALYLEKKSTSAEYYTTPAKAYFIPKIHTQTSYINGDVDIKLVNIMTADKIMYRFGSDAFKEYTGPISTVSLSDGEHTLEYYYNSSNKKTRKIIKNPVHPSKGETFSHNGSGHGNLLWKSAYEFDQVKARISAGGKLYTYAYIVDNAIRNGVSWAGTGGNRSKFTTGSLAYMVMALRDGLSTKTDYALAAKRRLLYTKSYIDPIGFELPLVFHPNPSTELVYRGYYDVNEIFDIAAAYDLVAAHFRSDQHANGMTPVEDLRIRDMLASYVLRCQFYLGKFNSANTAVDPSPGKGMWDSAHMIGALYTALAMPGYDTPYYGTSGFDGTVATHKWTPYRDSPESWKDVFYTYTDNGNSAHTARLAAFPNRPSMFNWFDGGLIMDNPAGDWFDRAGYYDYHLMGHCFYIMSNVTKRKLNASYPLLELSYDKANKGTLKPHKLSGSDTGNPQHYAQALLINEYFPTLAADAEATLAARFSAVEEIRNAGTFGLVFHNPDWRTTDIAGNRIPPKNYVCPGSNGSVQYDLTGKPVPSTSMQSGMYLKTAEDGSVYRTLFIK
jgi:hypothetical protein